MGLGDPEGALGNEEAALCPVRINSVRPDAPQNSVSSEPEGQRSPGKSQQPTGKKPTTFSCEVWELPFSCVSVPVGDDLFRAAIPTDGGGSGEGKGGDAWRGRLSKSRRF